jgi:hypothetical protein
MDHRGTTAWINLSAIRSNYRRLAELARGSAVCPVIKADAYGHGALAIAHALETGRSPLLRGSPWPRWRSRQGVGDPNAASGLVYRSSLDSIAIQALAAPRRSSTEEHVRFSPLPPKSVGKRAKAHIKNRHGHEPQGLPRPKRSPLRDLWPFIGVRGGRAFISISRKRTVPILRFTNLRWNGSRRAR